MHTTDSHRSRIAERIAFAVFAVLFVLAPLSLALVARADDTSTSTPSVESASSTAPTSDAVASSTDSAVASSTTSTSGDAGLPATTTSTTTLETGNATAFDQAFNQANTNQAGVGTSTAATTITNDNTASTTADASTSAQTGSNSVSGGAGAATITTGDALAATNVINVVNTNIINSQGIVAFLNLLFGGGFNLALAYDLSYFFGAGGATTPACSLSSCGDGMLTVGNTNDAHVTNTLVARAQTGENTATSTGSASIGTGDAYAAGNLLNLVNTNLVNSHYLLVAINGFGGMQGDITLPTADFFDRLLQAGATSTDVVNGLTSITSTSSVGVMGSTTAAADTGANTASTTEGTSTIATGDAHAQATTLTQANTDMVGGKTIYLLFNVFGDWTGGIQGLPAGLSWMRTPAGIAITSAAPGGLAALSDTASSTPGQSYNGAFSVAATNTAAIENDVHVWALTGDNYAASASGTAAIQTGNAYASANVMNIVNTNVIGANWILAIFNIFGDWHGNIAFGHPDLWIGGTAETPDPTPPGSDVTYHFTIANRGDLDATNVRLTLAFDGSLLSFYDAPSDLNGASTSTTVILSIGSLKKGESRDVSYRARAGTPAPGTLVPVPLSATISSTESDADTADNTEHLTITVGTPLSPTSSGGGGGGGPMSLGAYWAPDPLITMTKTAAASTTVASSTVDYAVTIKNTGGDAFRTLLTDTLADAFGTTIYSQEWDLDTIRAGETVKVTYSVVFDASTTPGLYTNTAVLTGQKGSSARAYATDMRAVSASTSIEVLGEGTSTESTLPAPKVAGASSCAPLITSYLALGKRNDPGSVHALQQFLHDSQGETALPSTGFFGPLTKGAVQRFQKKYAADILTPWGLSAPTGKVYYTTVRHINVLNCRNAEAFTLTPVQVGEIAAFRSKIWRIPFGAKTAGR